MYSLFSLSKSSSRNNILIKKLTIPDEKQGVRSHLVGPLTEVKRDPVPLTSRDERFATRFCSVFSQRVTHSLLPATQLKI